MVPVPPLDHDGDHLMSAAVRLQRLPQGLGCLCHPGRSYHSSVDLLVQQGTSTVTHGDRHLENPV